MRKLILVAIAVVVVAVFTPKQSGYCQVNQKKQVADSSITFSTESVVDFVNGLPRLKARTKAPKADGGLSFLKSRKTNGLEVPFVELGSSGDFSNSVMVFAYGDAKTINHFEFRLRCSTESLLDKYKTRVANRLDEFMQTFQRELPTEAKAAIAKIDSVKRNRSRTVYKSTIDGLTYKVRCHADGSNTPLVSASVSVVPKNEAVAFWIDHQTLKSKLAERTHLKEQLASKSNNPSGTKHQVDLNPMNKAVSAKGLKLAVVKAEIKQPQVKREIYNDVQLANDAALVLTITVQNTDDRRILRYDANMFTSRFLLNDDVENRIRGINYGAATVPVGALTGKEDIGPGQSAGHVEVFSVPPPKTEHLILTVDLKAFGGQGNVKFKVPVENIIGFTPSR